MQLKISEACDRDISIWNFNISIRTFELRFKILFQNDTCLKQILQFMVAATLGKNPKGSILKVRTQERGRGGFDQKRTYVALVTLLFC